MEIGARSYIVFSYSACVYHNRERNFVRIKMLSNALIYKDCKTFDTTTNLYHYYILDMTSADLIDLQYEKLAIQKTIANDILYSRQLMFINLPILLLIIKKPLKSQ